MVFSFALLLKQFALFVREITKNWFHDSLVSLPDWDVSVNKFYRMFYTPQPIHIDIRIWNENGNNEAAMISFQPLLGAKMDEVINGLLQLQSVP